MVMSNAGDRRRRMLSWDGRSGAAAEVGFDEPPLERPAPRWGESRPLKASPCALPSSWSPTCSPWWSVAGSA